VDRVRRAEPDDRAAAVATVTAAFGRDPAWSFLLEGAYDRLAPEFAGALFDTRVDAGTVWVTGDVAAVAMWEQMGVATPPSVGSEQTWQAYRTLAGEAAWARLGEYERAVDEARPEPPYWYLGVLATRPDRHGQGLATAVMTPVLEQAAREGLDCFLETSTVRNVRFYEGRGFTPTAELHIAGGPPTWWLRRRP
jgi:GNAT superfamily N-acetyltransferase